MSYRRWTLGLLAYVAPTFLLGLVWHLLLFKGYYDELAVYRADIVIPFGLISMVIQGSVYSFAYGRLLAGNDILQGALKFALIAGLLAWSYLVLTVAAKHWMSSVAGYVVIETAFTVVQFAVTGPLIASVYRNAR